MSLAAPLDAALLDRDGTINTKAAEGEYITRPEQLELLPGAAEAIGMLNRVGVPVVVVTNQRAIALRRMSEGDLASVHARLAELLAAHGAHLDDVLVCPHHRGACECRKPGTLLLERARDRLGLADLRNTVMIGDSVSDALAGWRVGARAMLIGDGHPEAPLGIERAGSLLEAVQSALAPHPARVVSF